MMEQEDPFKEFGGSSLAEDEDPFAEFGGSTLKKKDTPTVSKSGSAPSSTGLNPFQPSQAPTAPQVLTPEGQDQYITTEIPKAQALNKKLQGYISTFEGSHTPEEISAVRNAGLKPEEKIYKEDKTFFDGMKLGAKYLTSKVAGGALGLAEGANYLINKVDPQFKEARNFAFDILDEKAKMGLNPETGQNLGTVANAVGGLLEFAPAIATSASTGGASYLLQGLGHADNQVRNMKDQGVEFKNGSDDLYIAGSGLVNYFLMNKLPISKLLSKTPAPLREAVIDNASIDMVKALSGKPLTSEAIAQTAKDVSVKLSDQIRAKGVRFLESYAHTAKDLSALTGADFVLKEASNKLAGNDNFQQSGADLEEGLKRVLLEDAPSFAGLGAGIKIAQDPGVLFRRSTFRNQVVDALRKDKSDANFEDISRQLVDRGQEQGWSPQEIENSVATAKNIHDAAKSIPNEFGYTRFNKAIDLITGRKELEGELADIKASKGSIDPSIADIPSKEESLVQDKIEQANSKLQELATGKKMRYFEGDPEKESEKGKYYQQLGENGKKEEITETRFELENLEKEFKKPKSVVEQMETPEDRANKEINSIKFPEVSFIIEHDSLNIAQLTQLNKQVQASETISDSDKISFNEYTAKVNDIYEKHRPKNTEPVTNIEENVTEPLPITEPDPESLPIPEQNGIDIKSLEDEGTALMKKGVEDFQERTKELRSQGITKEEAVKAAEQEWLNTPDGKRYTEIENQINEQPIETIPAEAEVQPEPTTETAPVPAETNAEPVTESVTPKEAPKPRRKLSALRNEDIAKKRAELGFEERPEVERITNKELVKEAKRKIRAGEVYPATMVKDIISGEKKELEAVEVVQLKEYQLAKENELIDINDEIADLIENGEAVDSEIAKRDIILQEIQDAYTAGEKSGTASARSLQARKIKLLSDYSLASMLIKKRTAAGGEKLKPEQIEEVQKEYVRIKDLTDKLEAKKAILQQENANLRANNNYRKLKQEADFETRKTGRVVERESIQKDIDSTLESIKKKLREQRQQVSMNPIPVEMIPEIAKLAKLYTKKGINTLEGVIDNIHEALKDEIEGLTKDDIKDVLSEYDYDAAKKEEARLKAAKTRIGNRVKDLRDRLNRNDLSPRPGREPLKLDKEGKELRDELERVKHEFDVQVAKEKFKNSSTGHKWYHRFKEATGLVRALEATADVSALFNQGLIAFASHPVHWSRAATNMFKIMGKEKWYDSFMNDIKHSDDYTIMKDADLAITDKKSAELTAREEEFQTNWAERIPIIGKSIRRSNGKMILPGLDAIGISERAYSGFLTKLRVDLFREGYDLLKTEYSGEELSKQSKYLADHINNVTGRGNLGPGEKYKSVLSVGLFSPRFAASKLRLLSARTLWRKGTSPIIRKMYLKDMLKFIAFRASILGLYAIANGDDKGEKITLNPFDPDYGKIVDGKQHIDLSGGMGGYEREIMMLALTTMGKQGKSGKSDLSTASGRTSKGISDLLHFTRGKLAPIPAIGTNLYLKKDYIGRDYDLGDIPKAFLPMAGTNVKEILEENPDIKGALYSAFAIAGLRISTYNEREKKKKHP